MNVIFDVDGTLLNIEHRVPLIRPTNGGKKDWAGFRARASYDVPNIEVTAVYYAMHKHHNIIICTGRMEKERVITEWTLFEKVGLPRPHLMLMRDNGDLRADYLVKEDMLRMLRDAGMHPMLAFDDRQQVVDMWRKNGIRCCQVGPGNF